MKPKCPLTARKIDRASELAPGADPILTQRNICAELNITTMTLLRWRNDPRVSFPAPLRLGPGRIGWPRSVFETWKGSRVGGIEKRAA